LTTYFVIANINFIPSRQLHIKTADMNDHNFHNFLVRSLYRLLLSAVQTCLCHLLTLLRFIINF